MRSPQREILGFVLGAAVLLPALFWVQPRVVPRYQEVVLAATNRVLAAAGAAVSVAVGEDGGWQALRRPWQELPITTTESQADRGAVQLVLLNLALLPALLLATPVSLWHRLRLLALGLPLVFACHVATLLGLVLTAHCPDLVCRFARDQLKISGQLFGFLQWALLTWGYWLRLLRTPAASGSARNRRSGSAA